MPPPQSGASGYSGKSGWSGYSGFSGKDGSVSGMSGLSGYSGFSGARGAAGTAGVAGASGYSGMSGYSGAAGVPPTGNLTISGSLTTGSGGGTTGDIALQGSASGTVHLRCESDAGTGIFVLPNTTGVHTLATLDDLNALYLKLTNV